MEEEKAKQTKLRQDIQRLHVNIIKRFLHIFFCLLHSLKPRFFLSLSCNYVYSVVICPIAIA